MSNFIATEKPKTVALSFVLSLIDTTLSEGVELEELLSGLPIERKDLDNPNFRLNLTVMTQLWQRAVELSDNQLLGLYVGEDIQLGSLHAFAPLAMNCPTLGTVIEYMGKYSGIISDGGQLSYELDETGCHIYFSQAESLDIPLTPYQVEGSFSSMVHISRKIVTRDIPPVGVHFKHKALGDIAEYERIFRSPVFFEAERNEIHLSRATMGLPIRFADPSLLSHHEAIARNIMASLTEEPLLSHQVTQIIHELGVGLCSPEAVAKKLNLSLRSVQRKLNQEETSYQVLVDDYRQDQSAKLLTDSNLPIAQIAEHLGYMNLSSFHRAFQRWYQLSPAQYRRQRTG